MTFEWNDEKNEILKKTRSVSFEEVVVCINENRVVDVLEHPDQEKYPGQRIYVIWYQNYAYAVPYVKDDEKQVIFLKTIYPSRLLTKRYREKGEKNE